MRRVLPLFFCLLLLGSLVPLSVPVSADEPDPPAYDETVFPSESTMGCETWRTVNWTTFRQLFQDHTDWSLEYKRYSYSPWTPGNQYLTIRRTWDESGFWKFTLVLDVPVPVYSVRFTFGIDLSCLQYVYRDGYEVFINFTANLTEIYPCMFNWSDIAHIPGIVITHGVQAGLFWFRLQKDNVPAGHYEFDPTMGYSSTGSQYTIANQITGIKQISPAYNGWASSISAYLLYGGLAPHEYARLALYNAGTGALLAYTTEITVLAGARWHYQTLNTPVKLFKNVNYRVVAWGSTLVLIGRDTVISAGSGINKSQAYGPTFPDPWTGGTTLNYKFAIYVNYTMANLTFTGLSPGQGETDVVFDEDEGLDMTGSFTSTLFPVTLRGWWSTNFSWGHIDGSRSCLYNYGPMLGAANIRAGFNGTAKLYHNTTNPKIYYFNLTGALSKNLSIEKVGLRSNTIRDPIDLRLYRSTNKVTWVTMIATTSLVQDTDLWVNFSFDPPVTAKYLRIDIYNTEDGFGTKYLSWWVTPLAPIFRVYAGDQFMQFGSELFAANGSLSFPNQNITALNTTYQYYIDTSNYTNASYLLSAYAPFINFTTTGDDLDVLLMGTLSFDPWVQLFCLFVSFFVLGYLSRKPSGGFFMIFAGFALIGLGVLAGTDLLYVNGLTTPIGAFLGVLGAKKAFYTVTDEEGDIVGNKPRKPRRRRT